MSSRYRAPLFAASVLLAGRLAAQLPPDTTAKIDAIAQKSLSDGGTPSVLHRRRQKIGRIAYAQAYGNARIEPETMAAPGMRYRIRIHRPAFNCAFTTLLLVLKANYRWIDKVAKYLPNLTARRNHLRELLSHTSGYQDYYPLD